MLVLTAILITIVAVSRSEEEGTTVPGMIEEGFKPCGSFSVAKTHAEIYTNIDGREKEVARTRERVNKDGRLLAEVERRVDKAGDGSRPRIVTSVDIPSKNVHEVIRGDDLGPVPSEAIDYILKTGDERGVTTAVREYLRRGLMSRANAVDFLREIENGIRLQNRRLPEKS